jgi:hypothetical protein
MNPVTCCLLIICLGAGALHAQGNEPTVFEIQSRWDQAKYLTPAGEALQAGAKDPDLSRWTLEPARSAYHIRHRATGQYITLPEGSDVLALTATPPGDDRGRWFIIPIESFYAIQNVATGRFINIEKSSSPVDAALDKKPGPKHWWSGLWKLNHIDGPPPARFYQPGQVIVTAPAYGSTIRGDTTIHVRAPGFGSAVVKSWLPGGPFGSDSTVGSIELSDDGAGSIVFPADKYPRGPITIRVMAAEGSRKSNYYLMVYNEGGIAWNEGIPPATPAPAEGMKLVFADDFDKPELSISKTGKGTTYTSHKPGGGDFSGIPFGDHENPQTTPFSQIGTYLRIRADQSKKTTGLISSMGMDGTGFLATAPAYFECRFIAQSAPGTWPAFWLMTQDVHKGLKEPADELDVIEAYGGEGPGNPNQRGYWIHSHYWNQAPDGKKDYTQDRFAGQINMTEIKGGGGASWHETFHTYGVLVGRDDTVYYCDGIEVARHKTARLSGSRPLFFFANLAVGGASGWKIDLSQYDGLADMYIDYIRVYQAP